MWLLANFIDLTNLVVAQIADTNSLLTVLMYLIGWWICIWMASCPSWEMFLWGLSLQCMQETENTGGDIIIDCTKRLFQGALWSTQGNLKMWHFHNIIMNAILIYWYHFEPFQKTQLAILSELSSKHEQFCVLYPTMDFSTMNRVINTFHNGICCFKLSLL